MAKKLKINEHQLKVLTTYIKEQNKPIGFLTEEVVVQDYIIQEGWKDIVLGVAMLAGIGLTGQNKAMAQKAVNDPYILQQVQDVLQDDRIEDVADSLEAAGMSDAMEKIVKNADKLEKNFNAKAVEFKGIKGGIRMYHGKELARQDASHYEHLANKLKAGYAISDISQDTLRQVIEKRFPQDPVIDSLSLTVDAGDYFDSGDYVLSEQGKTILEEVLKQIGAQDATVVGVKIVSSTDKQRVSSRLDNVLSGLGYTEGNEGLSTVRNDQLKKELMNLGVDSNLIKQDIKWDEGAGELGAVTPQDASARYVKLVIDAIHIEPNAPEDVVVKDTMDVIVYNFELVKIKRKKTDLKLTINWGSKKGKTKTSKCKINACPTF